MSRKKTGAGRPRKNGPPKYGEGQAAKQRKVRVLKRWRENPETLRAYHLTDLKNLRNTMQRLYDTKGNKKRLVALAVLDEHIKQIGAYLMAKRAKNEAKRNAPKKEVKKAMNAAEKYADVLVKLKAGELVEGFTLLPKAKARINHTVDHLFDLDDGTALCKYKDV